MFEDAVRSYDLRQLDVDWDDDSLASVAREIAATALFLLGEAHARYDTPSALYTLFHALGFRSLALEWEPVLEPVVQRFIATDVVEVPPQLEQSFASGDGTLTAGHFALLRRLSDERRLDRVILFDDTPTEFDRPWAERDHRMAKHLLRARDASIPTLVVAGGFHTLTDDQDGELPLGAHVLRALGPIPTGRLEYDTGRTKFFRGGDGVYVFELPDARPAFVPRLP